MKEISLDPSRRLDLYLRIDRDGDVTFSAFNEDGTEFSLSYDDFQLVVRRNPGDRISIIDLTIGDGLTINENKIIAHIDAADTLVNEGEYFWELINLDANKTWVSGLVFFHNGAFDAENNDAAITISQSQSVTIYLTVAATSGGGGSGTVKSISVGGLSPLFTANVATPTTTPAVTFAQVTQNANLVFAGPATGAAAAPTFRSLVSADIPDLSAVYQAALGFTPENVANKATDFLTINNTLYPTTQAVNDQIISRLAGMAWKSQVACATTANITLSGEQTIDGVATSSSRVLVKNQSTASENGIYVSAAGAWARASDADTGTDLQNAVVPVAQGTSNADTTWNQTADGITIGVTSVVWGPFGTSAPDATSTVKGIARLYPSTSLGTNTDGAPDQNAVKTYVDDHVVAVDKGGTNITSYAVGDLLYASGATALSKLAAVATGSVLGSAGTTTAPAYLAVSNGLTATATTFKLGGALTADTNLSGAFSLGIGVTPAAKLHVVGLGTTTGELFRLADNTPTTRLSMLDNGSMIVTGGASGAGATVYTFNPTVTATANTQTQYGADFNMNQVDGGFTGLTRAFWRFRLASSATNTYEFGTSSFTTNGVSPIDFKMAGDSTVRNSTGALYLRGGSGSSTALKLGSVFTTSVDASIGVDFTSTLFAIGSGSGLTRTFTAFKHSWALTSANANTINMIGWDYDPTMSSVGGSTVNHYLLWRSGNMGLGDNTPSEKLSVAGNVKLRHLIGQSTAPSVAAGAGAGTTPTVTLSNATDISGLINLTTGTTPTGANAVILTITFNAAYGVAPNIILQPANDATASLPSNTVVFATSTTTTLVITSGAQPLTASTDYKWFFHAIQ